VGALRVKALYQAAATGGDSGSGCSGSFEIVQRDTGLCVAKMITITGPSSDAGSADYSINVTEVTQGQYEAWVATNPPLPESTDLSCGYVASYAEQSVNFNLMQCARYAGTDADHHPVGCVDWCDAYAYCKRVGKRLCGAIGGGSNDYSSYADASTSQWYRACSAGGMYTYPYGNTVQTTYCNGAEQWSTAYLGLGHSVAVGALPNCVTSATGYADVYDLCGNADEWEDSCSGTGQLANCRIRGGSFDAVSSGLYCSVGNIAARHNADKMAFRR
jgi:formylglycine-generating enzyme required for sulfatase activity